MSLKDKARKIDFGSLPGVVAQPAGGDAAGSAPRPKTAPGMMMAHAADQRSELLRENDSLKAQVGELSARAAHAGELQDELKAWDGAKATRLLDPALISRSRWANRDLRHFSSAKFAEVKAEIASAGGNVQPVKVRPLPVGADGVQRYELVYGHRRHQACLELGLPVLALIDNVGDVALFVEMDRENRSRTDLSAWEQGVMYRRALDDGLFPSNRKLAEAVGVDLGNLGRALSLAKLADALVEAFDSPLDLQFRWAKPLSDAWDADPDGMRARADEIRKLTPRPKAKEVFERLTAPAGEGGCTVQPPPSVQVQVGGKRVATVSLNARGAAAVAIEPGLVVANRLTDLAALIEKFLASAKARGR